MLLLRPGNLVAMQRDVPMHKAGGFLYSSPCSRNVRASQFCLIRSSFGCLPVTMLHGGPEAYLQRFYLIRERVEARRQRRCAVALESESHRNSFGLLIRAAKRRAACHQPRCIVHDDIQERVYR